MNLVNMRYKTLGYLLTVLKSGQNSYTIELTVHTSCYFVLDLLSFLYKSIPAFLKFKAFFVKIWDITSTSLKGAPYTQKVWETLSKAGA